jgi:hypothetical protein
MDPNELRAEIQEEIALNIYAPYKTEKYLLPPEAWRIFQDVVIVEFLIGFFDFESLGNGLRSKVDKLIRSYRDDPKLTTLDLSSDVDRALSSAQPPDEAKAREAQERLTGFLVSYGIDPQLAREHAAVIAQQIRGALHQQRKAT